MNRRGSIALLAAFPVAAVAQPAAVRVRIGSAPSEDAVAALYAIRSGMFAKAGLDVSLDKQANGAVGPAAVAAGTYDFGKTSFPSIVEAHDRGVPFVVVAPGAIYDTKAPYTLVLVPLDSPIRTGRDANGLTFSVSALGDLGDFALRAWVDHNGGDSHSLHVVELPFPAVPAAVEEGRIAGGVVSEPTISRAQATGKFRFIRHADAIATRFYVTVWFATRDYACTHPEVVRTFSRVMAEAGAYTNAHHDETAAMMAEFTGVQLAVVQRMNRAIEGTSLDVALLQPVIATMYAYGLTKRAIAARELIDPNAVTH